MVALRSTEEAFSILEGILGEVRQTRRAPDWERYAKIYDLSVGELITYQALITNVLSKVDIRPGMVVVDAATGTANLIQELIGIEHDLVVHGFENAPGMLEIARDKFSGFGTGNIHIHDADLTQPDWVERVGDGIADLFISVNTVYTLPDPLAFFRGARRVLKHGAPFVMSDPTTTVLAPIMVQHLAAGGEFTPVMREMVEINLDIKAWAERGRSDDDEEGFDFHSTGVKITLLEQAGFGVDTFESDYAGVNTTIVAYAV